MTIRRKLAFGFCVSAIVAAIGAFALRRSTAQPAAASPPPVTLSPEARTLLDQVRQAYASLSSLTISGTFAGNLDIDGVHQNNKAQFSGLYSSAGLFRNEMSNATDAATTPPSADAILGNTGANVYLFFPEHNRYQIIDAPKGKVNLESLGEDVADILRNQNLSLALALSGDAEAEVLQDATSATRIDDVKIDGQTYPAILVLHPLFDQTLVIDPQTHLLRRMVADVAKNARMKGAKEVKSALLTLDFANSKSAAIPAAQFAWSPPPGAQPVTAAAQGDASTLDGKPVPSFSLPDMNGNIVTDKSLKGTVYVMDLWATWCGPCVASLPHLDAMYKDFKGKGVKFFAVNQQEDKATIQKFISDTKLSIPVLMDSDGKAGEALDTASAIPFTIVVGKDGKVIKAALMGGAEDQLRAIINDAIKP